MYPLPPERSVRIAGLHAFTLIELLVVVAIIALLVAILLPSLSGARDEAERIACASNLHQFGLALRMYADDYDGKAPMMDYPYNWYYVLGPYLARSDAGDASQVQLGHNYFHCPEDAPPIDLAMTGIAQDIYNMNYPVVTAFHWRYPQGGPTVPDAVPATTMVMTDAGAYIVYIPSSWPLDTDWDGDGANDTYSGLLVAAAHQFYNYFRPRHNNSANILYADAHVTPTTMLDWSTNEGDVWGKRP